MSYDNSNQNPITCSVALSTSRYGTTTSPDRHVLGYHITPDNEPITNSFLNRENYCVIGELIEPSVCPPRNVHLTRF